MIHLSQENSLCLGISNDTILSIGFHEKNEMNTNEKSQASNLALSELVLQMIGYDIYHLSIPAILNQTIFNAGML